MSATMCKREAQLKPTTKQDVQYKVEEQYSKPTQDRQSNPPYRSKEWLVPLCFNPNLSMESGKEENKIVHKEII